ncbi:MAG TPA: metallophosphoesterase [Acidobacteriaceae bacterium]|nr:metallophosphoesterase [Acidobacteriaceae bacterium]
MQSIPDEGKPLQESSDETPASTSPNDGIDRRNFLSCMAWAGTGLLWTITGGVPVSKVFAAAAAGEGDRGAQHRSDFSFAQISDSHIGFHKPVNQDVTGTLKIAIDRINALPVAPDLVLHTGDISHMSKDAEFDTADQVIRGARTGRVFYVPGEHDTALDRGARYLQRYGKGTLGSGWYSFDHKDVHFIGLNNSRQIDAMGDLGADQLQWLKSDLALLSASTPIIVFAHIPLWMLYPQWGWGTKDGAEALSYLRRFGSVTVLNGHIHQVTQKIEGNLSFHTAMSTAFPQPAPGSAPHPGPMAVPAGTLNSVLGISSARFIARRGHLAVIDKPLDKA